MINKHSVDDELIDKVLEDKSFFQTTIITFITVFIAELGDKTQIATLLLSAGYGKPILVFIGAAVALICTSLLSVALGTWLATKIPENLLNNMAGIIMLGIGLLLLSEVSFSDLKILEYL